MSGSKEGFKPLIAVQVVDSALESIDGVLEGRSTILAYLILLHAILTNASQYS